MNPDRKWCFWMTKNRYCGVIITFMQRLPNWGVSLSRFSSWTLFCQIWQYCVCCDIGQNVSVKDVKLTFTSNRINPCNRLVIKSYQLKEWHSHVSPAVWVIKSQQRLPLTLTGVRHETNSVMTVLTLAHKADRFSCHCNSIQSIVSIVHLRAISSIVACVYKLLHFQCIFSSILSSSVHSNVSRYLLE